LAVGNFNLLLGREYVFLDGTTWILNAVLTLNACRGDILGVIYSPRTFEEIAEVESPQDGLVFSIVENPIVVAGQPLVGVPEIIEEITN